jgi:hypothetical protein
MRRTIGYPALALTLAYAAGFGMASLNYDGRAGEALLFLGCVALALTAIAATVAGQWAVADEIDLFFDDNRLG